VDTNIIVCMYILLYVLCLVLVYYGLKIRSLVHAREQIQLYTALAHRPALTADVASLKRLKRKVYKTYTVGDASQLQR